MFKQKEINFFLMLFRVATLPGNLEFDNLGKNNLEKPEIWEILKKPGKTLNFEQKSLEKPRILTIFTCPVVKFRFESKNLS